MLTQCTRLERTKTALADEPLRGHGGRLGGRRPTARPRLGHCPTRLVRRRRSCDRRPRVVHSGALRHADCIVEAAQQLKCGVVVTVGAAAEGVPHTRSPQVFGSTTNGALARRLGLSRPQYQGPTGVVGVIQERLDREGLTGVSLRVGVPHYLSNAQHPKSSAALLRHLEHVLGVPTSHGMMYEEIQRWEELHDAAVDGDQQTEHYVKMLEEEYDRRTEASVPTGDDLAAEFERFLREENGNDEPGEN
ncbi:MAG: PAC2 family protein [Actinobacteria bacterium]|nr:PAC2 family protein [Actinomycetota bacterium]